MAEKTIGKAYVQILPTTEGIEGKMSSLLKPAAEKAGGEGGTSAGVNFAKKLIAGIAAAGIAQKVGGFIKDAVAAGGALQQSIGGIETLFGDQMAGYMIRKANEAYKTAGISANDYMQQVTSFSASLLQSLDGDTQKAAVTSDRIMRDMADNANKFGTDMGSIQHAYQGFSKQNYTMLDNLKLGYGGTKSEAERLVNEMSKLTDVQAELGIEVKEGDLSFANLANAISVAQKNMGVMGTTAKESDGTLTGSFASMGAAFSNLKAQMALGGDIEEPLKAVAETGITAAKNMIPMIKNVLSALPEALSSVWESLANSFDVGKISQMLVEKIQQLPDLIGQFAEWLQAKADGEGESQFGQAMASIIVAIGKALIASLPALASVIDASFQMIVELIGSLLGSLLTAFDARVNEFLDKGKAFVDGIKAGIEAKWGEIRQSASLIVDRVKEGIQSKINQLLTKGREFITKVRAGIVGALSMLISVGASIINTVRSAISGTIGSLASVGLDIVRGIWSGISGGLDWIKNMIRGWVGNVKDFLKMLFGIASPSKWAADTIGAMIPAGIAVGIEDNTGVIDRAVAGLKTDMADAFKPTFYQTANYKAAETPGNVSVVIYATPNQSADDLYNTFERRLTNSVLRKGAAYA